MFSVKPEIRVHDDVIGSLIRLPIHLQCKIQAFPDPIIYWSGPIGKYKIFAFLMFHRGKSIYLYIYLKSDQCLTGKILDLFTGNVVVNNNHISTKQTKLSNFSFLSVLSIKSLTDHDFGHYTCSAKNTIGVCSKTIKLYRKNLNKHNYSRNNILKLLKNYYIQDYSQR